MKAYVVEQSGPPEVLMLKDVPDPVPTRGQVLIEIAAFGLNRAEAVTRAGGSGNAVPFPRIIGLECVGRVLHAPDGRLNVGQKVAAVMGGMGRRFDGSYAQRVVVPVEQVIPLETTLSWIELAAIPETFLTAWGCLFEALRLPKIGARVLVRPGASALGLAITQIVKHQGGHVIGVTRSPHKAASMLKAGMAYVIISEGNVAQQVRQYWPDGPTGIVDTVTSALTLRDDLVMKGRGRLCIAGSLAGSSGASPGIRMLFALVRPSVRLYSSEKLTAQRHGTILQDMVRRVEQGVYTTNIDRVFDFDAVVEAHQVMEQNGAVGKLVVRVTPA